MNEDSFWEILLRQLDTLNVFIQRPVVQRQLLALLVMGVLAWVLTRLVRRLVEPTLNALVERQAEGRLATLQRVLPALAELYYPLLAILLVQGARLLFAALDYPAGLLANVMILFWLLLAYRVIVALLYLWLGMKWAHYLEWRLLFPLALWVLLLATESVLDISSLADVELFTLSGTPITLGRLFISIFIFYLFILGSSLLQDVLSSVIMPRTDADPGVVKSVAAVTRYFFIILGVVVALGAMGFSLSTLAVIGGGLSIGVGFGLQQIIANFIAGILLVFEQSLRPGDIIELNGEIGTVERLSIRSTLVRTNDNVELIIPNETFLTDSVKTYTKSSRLVRVPVNIGVSYDANVEQVCEILMGVARAHEAVKRTPDPNVFFMAFGDSSLNFQLNVWVDDPIRRQAISSELHFAIWREFQVHGIEVPFPQRDLNLRGGWEKLASEQQPEREQEDGEQG